MSFNFRKTAAACAAIILTASMCGCGDSGYIGTINGQKCRTGVYLSALLTAAGNAKTEVSDTRKEAGDTSEVTDVFVETVDGQNAIEWIKAEALKSVKRNYAADKLFNDAGLVFDAECSKEINDQMNSLWNDENIYAQYIYGFTTMGEYYDSIGIGKDSLKEIYINNDKKEDLFMSYYDTDGTKAVSTEDFNAHLTETRTVVKYIQLDFEDKYGVDLREDADIQAVKDTAADYVKRLNNGVDFTEIQYEHDLAKAQNEAAVKAEEELESMEEKPADENQYIQDAINAATAEKKTSSDELDVVISKESSSLSEDLTDFVWNKASADGKAVTYETESCIYVVVREDITTKTSWIDSNKSTVLHEMMEDDFNAILDETASSFDVSLDSYLVDTKYAPNKIKGLN